MSLPQQHPEHENESLVKQAINSQKNKLRNKLLKKGAKLAAAAIKKMAVVLAKLLMSLLSYIGLPVILICIGIIVLVLIISLSMSYFHAKGENLSGVDKEIYEYIVKASNSTVDMSDPFERQYRVPPELIASSIQVEAFQKYNTKEDIKEIIDRMAKELAPTFIYGKYNEWIETRTTTCVNNDCTTTTQKVDNYVKKIEEVEDWQGITYFMYEEQVSNWSQTSSSSETEIKETKNKDGEIVEETITTTVTVEQRKQFFTSSESQIEDYSKFDSILNSYDMGLNDKKLIEINYLFAGGTSNYTNWLEGKSFGEGFGLGSIGYSCSPTGEVNMQSWDIVFSNSGVLAGRQKEIIDISEEKGIDPVLFAAISLHESAYGKSNAIRSYNNPGGLMNPKTGKLFRFSSLSEGLQSMGRTLHNRIRKDGLNTIEKLGSVYAPVGAANDPTNLNKNWVPTVTSIVSKLGGLTMNCTPQPVTDLDLSGVAVVDVGKKYIGKSVYKWGGGRTQSDIDRGLFDCSGFVYWAYRAVGVDMGKTGNTDTLKNLGTAVPVSQMKPGDMVFFDSYKKDGHVGIYVGNGQFIGSQSSTGVAIESLTNGYWGQRFNGRVKRLIN